MSPREEEEKKKGIVGTKGYVSRERKKDEPESVVGEGCRIRSDKWRKGGPGHVNRGQKKEEEEAGQMHPRAWTQVLSSLLAIRMDPRILSGRGPAAKTVVPRGRWSPCALLLYPQERTHLRGGQIFFIHLRSWPIIFSRTLFSIRETSVGTPPFSRNCRLLVFSFLLPLSYSRARLKAPSFFFKKRIWDVVRDIFYLNFGNFIQCSFIDRCLDTIFFFKWKKEDTMYGYIFEFLVKVRIIPSS